MFIKLIFSLLILLPEVVTQSICYLDATSVFNCSDVGSVCQNYTTIVAATDTSYQCSEPLVLSAYNLSISGNFSGLSLSGTVLSVYNMSVGADLVIGSKSSLR